MEEVHQWTSSTCSLAAGEGCREKDGVRSFVTVINKVIQQYADCKFRYFNLTTHVQPIKAHVYVCPVGKNVVHQLGVTLEEMYNGTTRKLGLQKNVICEKCDGMYCLVAVF